MGVLLTGFSATANAQEAELQAALSAIKSKAANVAELAKTAYKKNKKNPEALVAIGRAFYEQKDTANARQFAEYANEAGKPKYQYAPAYLLLGDIESAYGTDGGKAAGFYNQAITFDPKNPEGYKKWAMVYRKISPTQAAKKLQDMKVNCPNEDIDAFTAHIYMLAGDEKQAYENYKKADITKLDKGNLNEFARASYFTGHFADALKASEAGIKLVPRNPTFNRLAMFSNYELKNYDAAKSYINKYFNETDSATFSEYDHYYTALIYKALEDKAKAFEQFNKALELVSDSSMIKRWDILKTLSDSHVDDNDFINGIKRYKEFLGCKPNATMNDFAGLANMYRKQAAAIDANLANEEAKVALRNADAAYEDLGNKFEDAKVYAYYMRANVNSSLDPTQKAGLAKPLFEKVVELLEPKADKDETDVSRLKTAYHYLMSYSFLQKNDKATAKTYASKILAMDPNYAPAIQIRDLK